MLDGAVAPEVRMIEAHYLLTPAAPRQAVADRHRPPDRNGRTSLGPEEPAAARLRQRPARTHPTALGSTVCCVRNKSCSARHGQAADSEQILMEDYHCSGREVFSDLIKVGEND
jgi:hypothetical protein